MGYALHKLSGAREEAPADAGTGGFFMPFLVFLAFFLVPVFWTGAVVAALVAGGLHVLLVRRIIVGAVAPVLPMLALPLWALLSAVWSEAPDASLWHGAQLCGTVLIALVLARTTPARTLVAALLFAGLITVIAGLALGQGDLMLNRPLAGGMGSKNMMASYAGVTLLAALAVALDARQAMGMRLVALLALGAGITALVLSRSAGAWISTIAGAAFLALLALSAWLPRMARGAAFVVFLAAAPLTWVAFPDLGQEVAAAGLQATGKDPTLTGRTDLWTRAEPIIAQRPALGHGYKAFWRQGDIEAEGLWRMMHIRDRQGFNFHNQYIDLAVELGIVGALIFVLTALLGGLRVVAYAIAAESLSVSFFAAAFFTLIVRTPVETAIVAEFNIFAVVFFMACGMGFARTQPV